MRRYAFSENTPMFHEQYELTLEDDGTFSFGMSASDPAGGAGGYSVGGRWRQAGDTITFEIVEKSEHPGTLPTTATVRGDELDVAGVGTFRTST